MGPATIKRKYQSRIKAILKNLAQLLNEKGYKTEGPAISSDASQYSLEVLREGKDKVSIDFTIMESEECEGEKGGVNFALDIVECGCILGGITPYNYTDKCWVPRNKPDQIEERFKILEGIDWSGLHNMMEA